MPELLHEPLTVMDLVVLWMSVPLAAMVRLLATVRVNFTFNVAAATPPMVSDWQVTALLPARVGWLVPVKFASPMIASSVAVGTPAVQLVAANQLVPPPIQEVWACPETPQNQNTNADNIQFLRVITG